jgi:hypothetical protein
MFKEEEAAGTNVEFITVIQVSHVEQHGGNSLIP